MSNKENENFNVEKSLDNIQFENQSSLTSNINDSKVYSKKLSESITELNEEIKIESPENGCSNNTNNSLKKVIFIEFC